MTATLFGISDTKKAEKRMNQVVTSVSYNQESLLRSIIHLHCPFGIECDPTYNKGGFYKHITQPRYKFDLTPLAKDVVKADAGNLPLADGAVRSLMFDPPFVVSAHVTSEEYLMHERFSSFRNITDLRTMYARSIREFSRVLKTHGILIVKCQDFTHGRKNYFMHVEVRDMAVSCGFKPVDFFILLAHQRFIGGIHQQQHSRKFHSYFWVFKKGGKK